MARHTIIRYEAGDRKPKVPERIRIADYFGVSVDYLLERTENLKLDL